MNKINLNYQKLSKFQIKYLKIFILVVFCIIPKSCKKDTTSCGIEKPQTKLAWLHNSLNRVLCAEVYSLVYGGKEYLIITDCPGSDEMAVFYDCAGNKTCEFGGIVGSYINCNMPDGFTIEFYYSHRKFIYSQSRP